MNETAGQEVEHSKIQKVHDVLAALLNGVFDPVSDDRSAASEDDESDNLTMIITVSVIVVIIAAALAMFMRRGGESEPVAVEKDFSQNLMAGQFRPFQPTMVEQHVEVSPQVVEPIVQAPMPVQQWTDESGHTWRTMDDGSTQWWNGTDWQNA